MPHQGGCKGTAGHRARRDRLKPAVLCPQALRESDPRLSVSVRSACPGFHARATAAPPFSGPRSRGNVVTCKPMPRQRGFALDASGTPRMGPAPGGTTAALLPLSVACYACACCHSSAGSPALVARSQADSGEWPQMAGAAASERQPSGRIKLDDRFPGTNSVDRLSRSDPQATTAVPILFPQSCHPDPLELNTRQHRVNC